MADTESGDIDSDELIDSVLNDRQVRFCQEYVIDLNASAAYERAGYENKSNNVVRAASSRLLADVNVQKLITRLKNDRFIRSQIDADKVLAQVHRLAFADIRDLYDASGDLIPIPELPDDLAAAIQSVKVSDRKVPGSGTGEDALYEKITEYKLVDKRATNEMLLKHLGELSDKVDHTHEVSGKVTFNMQPVAVKAQGSDED